MLSTTLSLCPSVHHSVTLSITLSLCQSLCPSVNHSVYHSVPHSVPHTVHPSITQRCSDSLSICSTSWRNPGASLGPRQGRIRATSVVSCSLHCIPIISFRLS